MQDLQFCVNVSASKPHKILSASFSLLEILGYSKAEMIGRSITVLQGPLSDAVLLESGISDAWKLELNSFSFTLYSRTGKDFPVDIQFLPCADAEGKVIGSTLQMQPAGRRTEGPGGAPAIGSTHNLPQTTAAAPPRARPSSRSAHNALTGMDIRRALQRADRAAIGGAAIGAPAATRPPP